MKKKRSGEDVSNYKFKGEVKELPEAFKGWASKNAARVARWKSKPYFITDNEHIPEVKYHLYNPEKWQKVAYYKDSSGYVVSDLQRIKHSRISKNETEKYEKELSMCRVLGKNGYRVEMLEEIPGISSPDITINGIKADLKSLSSANNIERHAKDAIRKQGAEIVIFEFKEMNDKIKQALIKMGRIGIHGKYFASGDDSIYDF